MLADFVSGRAILQLALWHRNAGFGSAGVPPAILMPGIFAKEISSVLKLSRVLSIRGGWECNLWKS
jgi:hypothetical protein